MLLKFGLRPERFINNSPKTASFDFKPFVVSYQHAQNVTEKDLGENGSVDLEIKLFLYIFSDQKLEIYEKLHQKKRNYSSPLQNKSSRFRQVQTRFRQVQNFLRFAEPEPAFRFSSASEAEPEPELSVRFRSSRF